MDKGCDALLPSDCPQPLSQAMFREVMNDIPVRLVRPRRNDDARKMLAKYAEAARWVDILFIYFPCNFCKLIFKCLHSHSSDVRD